MSQIDILQFELERRVILFKPSTTLPDNTQLGFNADPNTIVTPSTAGETLVYNCPSGTWYLQGNGTLWYKESSPNTWVSPSGAPSGKEKYSYEFDTTSTGTLNPYNIPSGKDFIIFLNSTTIDITTIAAGTDGQKLNLFNATGNPLTVTHGSGVISFTGADVDIPNGAVMHLSYDGTINTAWIMIDVTSVSASGGASDFIALTDTPSAYTGNALRPVKVSRDETELEFEDPTYNEDSTTSSANVVKYDVDGRRYVTIQNSLVETINGFTDSNGLVDGQLFTILNGKFDASDLTIIHNFTADDDRLITPNLENIILPFLASLTIRWSETTGGDFWIVESISYGGVPNYSSASNGDVLTIDSGQPSWQPPATSGGSGYSILYDNTQYSNPPNSNIINDYDLGSDNYAILTNGSSSNIELTGVQTTPAQQDGDVVRILNATTTQIRIRRDNANSLAANRITTIGLPVDVWVQPYWEVTLMYVTSPVSIWAVVNIQRTNSDLFYEDSSSTGAESGYGDAGLYNAVRFTSGTLTSIDGILPKGDGKELIIYNGQSGSFDLIHSTSANGIVCPDNVDLTIPPSGSAVLKYDESSGNWFVISSSLGSSSGGGETNTASNVGTGIGVFKTKSGADLQLRSIQSGLSDTLTVTENASTNEIDITPILANISEAEAGTDANKLMTPVTTKASIEFERGFTWVVSTTSIPTPHATLSDFLNSVDFASGHSVYIKSGTYSGSTSVNLKNNQTLFFERGSSLSSAFQSSPGVTNISIFGYPDLGNCTFQGNNSFFQLGTIGTLSIGTSNYINMHCISCTSFTTSSGTGREVVIGTVTQNSSTAVQILNSSISKYTIYNLSGSNGGFRLSGSNYQVDSFATRNAVYLQGCTEVTFNSFRSQSSNTYFIIQGTNTRNRLYINSLSPTINQYLFAVFTASASLTDSNIDIQYAALNTTTNADIFNFIQTATINNNVININKIFCNNTGSTINLIDTTAAITFNNNKLNINHIEGTATPTLQITNTSTITGSNNSLSISANNYLYNETDNTKPDIGIFRNYNIRIQISATGSINLGSQPAKYFVYVENEPHRSATYYYSPSNQRLSDFHSDFADSDTASKISLFDNSGSLNIKNNTATDPISLIIKKEI